MSMKTKSNHKRNQILLTSLALITTFAVFAVTRNGQLLERVTYGDGPEYTIRLDETNTPSSLAMDAFGSGTGMGRYVEFNYTLAKRSLSQHAVLDENGTLSNDPDTRITSMKSLVATFTGGEASLTFGPTVATLGEPEVLTSGVPLIFESDPYFFNLTNSGASDLCLTTLEVTYSCVNEHATMSFDTNGGSAISPITQAIGSAVSAPVDPTKPGYLFDDWYSDAALSIPYSFTVMPDADLTLYAKWAVDDAYPVLTIADFKDLDPEDVDLHFVNGTVLLCSPMMELIIISDDEDLLIAFGYEETAVGDAVRLGGYFAVEDGFTVMNGHEVTGLSVDVLSHDNLIELSPVSMTVAEYNLLDPDTTTNWGVYAEISGTVEIDHENHTVSLVSGEDSMPIAVFTQDDYNYLVNYDGFDVKIRGVIVPNMDDPEATVLMFLFNGHEDFIDLDHEDAELLTILEDLFRDYYETATYFPGQYLELPSDHPIIPLTIAYELDGANADKYDLETGRFDDDISELLVVDLHVTITLTETSSFSEFDIDLSVDPDIIITVADLLLLPDSETESHVIKAVVLNVQAQGEDWFLLVADATGVVYVNTDNDTIVPGDEIVAIGYKMTMDSIVFLANDPSRTVDHIRAHDQAVPLTPTVMSLADFNDLEPSYVSSAYRYYQLSGTLHYTDPESPETSAFYLTNGTDNVYIYATSAAARTILVTHLEDDVTMCGLAIMAGEPESQMVVLAYLAISGITVNS